MKKDVEKFMKNLKGNLSISHFDKEQTVKTSNELLKYVRFTSEYENEDISKKIYSGMRKGGIIELVKTLWEIKTMKEVDLDDFKTYANFSTVKFYLISSFCVCH